MNIAHLSKPWLPIPPIGYGGIERILHNLIREQTRSISITLFAPKVSNSGENVTVCSLFKEGQADKGLDRNIELVHAVHCVSECARIGVDLIHAHSVDAFLGISRFIEIPIVFTFHSMPTYEGMLLTRLSSDSIRYTFLTTYHQKQFPWINNGIVIPPGIDLGNYKTCKEKKEYLVYVGRISEQKGVIDAIHIASRAKLPIIIAGKARIEDKLYFDRMMAAIENYKHAKFIGEINDTERNFLVGQAAGLLFPIKTGEAFGLTQIEAMAVGTPVITYDVGASREIVADGKTGYIVDTIEDAVSAVQDLNKINIHDCRRHIATNFSAKRMAAQFIKLYKSII